MTDKKGIVSKGRWSDHKGIECKLSVAVLAAKNAGNVPIINYSAPGGWARYIKVSYKRAPNVIAIIDKYEDINLRQTALNLLKLEIDVEAFGIKYRQYLI